MIGTRRSSLDIVQEILSIGTGTFSDIRYAVGANFYESNRYLTLLVDRGLLVENIRGRRRVYAVTVTGQQFLKLLEEAAALMAQDRTPALR